jgi:zinc transport system substrate-binding protein
VKESNPHTWLSPKRASLECDAIGIFLTGAFPEGSYLIRKNLEEYKKSLELLSEWISRMVFQNRRLRLITFHDALDIFAADYGLLAPVHVEEVHGIPPSMEKIVFLVKEASSHKGDTVIVSESPHPDPITRRISEMSGAPIVWFNPILQGKKDDDNLYKKMIEESVEKLLPSSTM